MPTTAYSFSSMRNPSVQLRGSIPGPPGETKSSKLAEFEVTGSGNKDFRMRVNGGIPVFTASSLGSWNPGWENKNSIDLT